MRFFSKNRLLFLTAMITLSSCDKVDELTTIDISQDFEDTVNVVLTENSEGAAIAFEQSTTIDISSNTRIKENLKLIESVSIESFTYQFSNFDGVDGVMLSDASITVADITIAIDDVAIDTASSAGTIYTLTDASFLEAMAISLKNNPAITATFAATISSSPVTFDITFTIDATVTIDAL